MIGGLAWGALVIASCGFLAFFVTRRLGLRAGCVVIGIVAILNLPALLPYLLLHTGTGPSEFDAFLPPDDTTGGALDAFGALGYLAAGALTFAALTITAAACGAYFGNKQRKVMAQ